MAQEEIELVYGGSYSGIMGVISKTVLENNGKVTGIYPNGLLKLNCLEKMLLHLFLQKRSMKERYYYLKRRCCPRFPWRSRYIGGILTTSFLDSNRSDARQANRNIEYWRLLQRLATIIRNFCKRGFYG